MKMIFQWLHLFQTIYILFMVCVSATHHTMQLQVQKICEDWAILKWLPTTNTHKPPTKCDVIYRPVFSKKAKVVKVLPEFESKIKLKNLLNNSYYLCFLNCEGVSSNNVTFQTGTVCSNTWGGKSNVTDDEVQSMPTVVEDSSIAQSTIDVILGLVFGMLGICIVGVAAYYFWKNYRRRQRILRVFRQPHSDPFESLQNNMEDSSIAQL